MYTGCCLEQFDNLLQAFEAYKEAILFLKKSSRLGFSFQNLNSITISNSCSFLVEEAVTKLKLKFKKDKLDLLNMQQRLELQRKKEEYELLKREKLTKLRSIASGLDSNLSFKYKGDVKDFKTLLKKKMSFNLKDIGNDTLYVKIKVENYEDFLLFLKTTQKDKKNVIKSYQEIDQATYDGALESLANILK